MCALTFSLERKPDRQILVSTPVFGPDVHHTVNGGAYFHLDYNVNVNAPLCLSASLNRNVWNLCPFSSAQIGTRSSAPPPPPQFLWQLALRRILTLEESCLKLQVTLALFICHWAVHILQAQQYGGAWNQLGPCNMLVACSLHTDAVRPFASQ